MVYILQSTHNCSIHGNTFNIFSKTGETIEIDVTEQPDDVDVAVVSA